MWGGDKGTIAMSTRITLFLALFGALIPASALPSNMAAGTGTPKPRQDGIKVMIVGNSISQGFEGDWTWRYRIWEWFQSEGVAVDFVGPYTGTHPPEFVFSYP